MGWEWEGDGLVPLAHPWLCLVLVVSRIHCRIQGCCFEVLYQKNKHLLMVYYVYIQPLYNYVEFTPTDNAKSTCRLYHLYVSIIVPSTGVSRRVQRNWAMNLHCILHSYDSSLLSFIRCEVCNDKFQLSSL